MSKPIDQELLPCPFCGGRKTEVCHDDGIAWTRCKTCGATGPALSKYSGEEGEPCTDWSTRAAVQPASGAVPDEFAFEYRHANGEHHTVTVSREQVIEQMPDFLFEALCDKFCNCEPIGETNVVECCCDEYAEEFQLLAAAPHPVSGEQKPAGYRIEAFDQSGTVRRQQYSDRPFNSALNDALLWKGDFEVRSVPLYAAPPAVQDVAGLLEALGQISKMDERSVLGSIPPIRQTQSIAIRALAAHGAQQGEQSS